MIYREVSTPDELTSTAYATVDETARFLRVSRSMAFKLISNGEIPSRRYGRCVRVPIAWLREQANAGKQ